MNFKNLNVNSRVIENLNRIGINKPTDIQIKTIPLILNKSNLIAMSQTGSGKTVAFISPIITNLINNNFSKVLIISPTRDLANQIFENTKQLTKGTNIVVGLFYGGVGFDRQIRTINQNPNILIGTPGRLIDLYNKKYLSFENIDYIVLDEADEMINMGFLKDLNKIISSINMSKSKIALFSATISSNCMDFIKKYVANFEQVNINCENNKPDIQQIAYIVDKKDKFNQLLTVIKNNYNKQAIIFTRTIKEAKELSYLLTKFKYKVEALHSDRKQTSRQNAIKKFINYQIDYLVATDVASRGIDINNLELVINYGSTNDIQTYIHRIGRTGRIGKSGTAISIILKQDINLLKEIQKKTNSKIKIEYPKNVKEHKIKTKSNKQAKKSLVFK